MHPFLPFLLFLFCLFLLINILNMKKLLFLFALVFSMEGVAQSNSDHNFEISKNLDIFNSLYKELDTYYVDTLSAEKNINNALLYMLNQLDPYTQYYAENKTQELKQLTTGKYAGIGSVISFLNKARRCIIEEPYEGMPAALAGLRAGDILLSIDGKDYGEAEKGKESEYSSRVSESLRGDVGTHFELKVKRYGVEKPLTFRLTRRTVTMPSVQFYTMVNDSVGYALLTGFTEQTTHELQMAFAELKQKGMRRFILDLRGNGGGLLDQAVNVVGLFVPRGKEVVRMKGKLKEVNSTFKTKNEPADLTMPIVVLTDNGTASSAEITSGALQDYDRAVIIGQRTYGKGLVQQTRQLPYKTILKLTTSKYYIPSGRCIQAYSYKNGQPQHLPDSLSKVFHTANGRPVRDGGGITPDIVTVPDSLPSLFSYLSASDALRNYCSDYQNHHRTIARPSTFSLSDQEYNDFLQFLKKENFTYDTQSKSALNILRSIVAAEGYEQMAKDELNALEKKLSHNFEYDFDYWRKDIKSLVESELVTRYYYQKGVAEYNLRNDKDFKLALKVLCDDARYHRLLAPKKH